MPSRSDNTPSGHVSSFDSDNPRSSADCEGSSSLERDRATTITLPVRTWRNMMTHKYRGSIIVLSISKGVKPNEEQKEMISSFQ